MGQSIIDNLYWRYATKKYDASKKVSNEAITIIKEALRLVPTSYGLQPIKFLIIENPEIRKELLHYSYNQFSIVEASHLIVIASLNDIPTQEIDDYIENTATTRSIPIQQLSNYADFLKRTINNLSPTEKSTWAQKQAYIALGVLLDICAQLKIDTTPMEGFDVDGYDKVLKLTEKGLSSTLVIPIGFRHDEDATQHWKKVRKTKEELFEEI
ncbi:MAG TPA: NAD(P)H-dependent oxidoreductase [Taishania sp.]|nr:NAD(P)H-dependent oxidoreductase [Taishania sp.]HNS42941.1 NAD(P)H-dependent oxidoreductase [Taishania sp.]